MVSNFDGCALLLSERWPGDHLQLFNIDDGSCTGIDLKAYCIPVKKLIATTLAASIKQTKATTAAASRSLGLAATTMVAAREAAAVENVLAVAGPAAERVETEFVFIPAYFKIKTERKGVCGCSG